MSYVYNDNGVFPKWNRTFSEFRESGKSPKQELRSILAVSSQHSGSISVSYTRDSRFEYSKPFNFQVVFSLNSLNHLGKIHMDAVEMQQEQNHEALFSTLLFYILKVISDFSKKIKKDVNFLFVKKVM